MATPKASLFFFGASRFCVGVWSFNSDSKSNVTAISSFSHNVNHLSSLLYLPLRGFELWTFGFCGSPLYVLPLKHGDLCSTFLTKPVTFSFAGRPCPKCILFLWAINFRSTSTSLYKRQQILVKEIVSQYSLVRVTDKKKEKWPSIVPSIFSTLSSAITQWNKGCLPNPSRRSSIVKHMFSNK